MNNVTTDSFGRDTSLRMSSFIARFKGMSWAEITYLAEEEEEAEKLSKLQEERRKLQSAPNYVLEEGEVLE